jgi:hypothetical protein
LLLLSPDANLKKQFCFSSVNKSSKNVETFDWQTSMLSCSDAFQNIPISVWNSSTLRNVSLEFNKTLSLLREKQERNCHKYITEATFADCLRAAAAGRKTQQKLAIQKIKIRSLKTN